MELELELAGSRLIKSECLSADNVLSREVIVAEKSEKRVHILRHGNKFSTAEKYAVQPQLSRIGQHQAMLLRCIRQHVTLLFISIRTLTFYPLEQVKAFQTVQLI